MKNEIVYLGIHDVIPYEKNPRKNENAVNAVANSIKEFGFRSPIVVDKDMVIINGHTRLLAAKQLGLNEVPVIVASDLNEEQVRAFRLADNKVAEIAEWDEDLLQEELNLIEELDMSQFGFEDVEFEFEKEPEEDDFNVDDAIPEEPKAKLGDIYQLGEHRLMCGDSTKEKDVKNLCDGELIDMIFTDPPYNVNYTDGHDNERKIKNDNFSTDEEAGEKLWLPAFTNAKLVAKDCCSYYLCMPQGGTHMMMMMMMMKEAGWQVKHELIWYKNSIVLNRADYNYQHEPISYGWNEKHKFYGKGKYHTTSVWEFNRPTKSKLHPTMKPIELIAEALLNSSLSGDSVLDLFGGSGSTLIACEQLKRKCYMMEFDPKYVDVIIARWEQYTGKKAELIKE